MGRALQESLLGTKGWHWEGGTAGSDVQGAALVPVNAMVNIPGLG